MIAVILAAGDSTRMMPLTKNKPKPLLTVLGKPVLTYTLDQLVGLVEEVIIIIGYQGDMIKKLYGNNYNGLKINYFNQKDRFGTGHALLQVKSSLTNSFLVLNGDDIYHKDDIKALVKEPNSILAAEVETPEIFGVIEEENGNLISLIEKPKEPKSNLVNMGVYHFTQDIFKDELKISHRGEYEIVDYIKPGFKVIKAQNYWIPLSCPWHLLEAQELLISKLQAKNEGEVETGVTIKGIISIGKGTLIKSGAYIEGPVIIGENCNIGPNCYIRSKTVIGDNCKIGNAVEIKNSLIMNGSSVGHLSYIGDSVLGENVNIGAGSITANLRHDGKNISMRIKGQMMDTKRRKLGVIFGNKVHTGINSSFYPGRIIDKDTLPGEVVR